MNMLRGMIVALGALAIAGATPAAAQDMRHDGSHDTRGMNHDMGAQDGRGMNHDMGAQDGRGMNHDMGMRDGRGMHRDNGWHGRSRGWRNDRNCRTVWHHHRRVRRCW